MMVQTGSVTAHDRFMEAARISTTRPQGRAIRFLFAPTVFVTAPRIGAGGGKRRKDGKVNMKKSVIVMALALGMSAGFVMAQPQGGPPPFGGPPPDREAGPQGPGSGFHLLPPPVERHLDLTDTQRKEVAALSAEVQAKLGKILTREQMRHLKRMQRHMREGGPGRHDRQMGGFEGPRGHGERDGFGGPGGPGENGPARHGGSGGHGDARDMGSRDEPGGHGDGWGPDRMDRGGAGSPGGPHGFADRVPPGPSSDMRERKADDESDVAEIANDRNNERNRDPRPMPAESHPQRGPGAASPERPGADRPHAGPGGPDSPDADRGPQGPDSEE
jgi:hypothetical protein